jgi:hypothetical protein
VVIRCLPCDVVDGLVEHSDLEYTEAQKGMFEFEGTEVDGKVKSHSWPGFVAGTHRQADLLCMERIEEVHLE